MIAANGAENTIDGIQDVEDILDAVPPDFKLARKHGEASRIKNFFSDKANLHDDDQDLSCECCGMPTLKAVPKYNLCVGIKKLEALGSGFPLFYSFKIFTMIIMFMLFLLQGIYTIVIAVIEANGNQWITNNGEPPFVARISLGALGKPTEAYEGW